MGKHSDNTLLIVDDSQFILDRLIDCLKDHETIKEIFTAVDYDTAVKIIDEKKPGILLLDIQLPGKNGIDLLKFIVKEYPDIKVIMFSNLSNDYYTKLCKQIGARHFLDKSTDFELISGLLTTI